jgi:tRNA pseudouridine55 synthase
MGIFAVYKPKGMSSHDVIYHVRKATGVKRVGHGGTLDPLASGVLVVAVGRENTRQLATIVAKEKEYMATIKLGLESTTDDEEGEKNIIDESRMPQLDEIKATVTPFIGSISQMPPIYSALKVKGKNAYKYARQGKQVVLKARMVIIKDIEIISYEYPILVIQVVTGPGVYIRSLARDIGKNLGTGAYLADLERTRVGEYTLENAIALEDLKGMNE